MERRKIVVAMDSMKGCLDSLEASRAISEGLESIWPGVDVKVVPVSDGGEGMLDMVAAATTGHEVRHCVVTGPLRMPVEARSLLCHEAGRNVAYMDFASAAGLTLIPQERRDPLLTSSYGVGEMIAEAVRAGVKEIRLGLGGSATVDAAFGALQALGLRIYDSKGHLLPSPFTGAMLGDVARVEESEEFKSLIGSVDITLLCDVEAVFTGDTGAARTFGPQKGADAAAVETLEAGMERVRQVALDHGGMDLNRIPGTGAAGGAAGGLVAFAGAKIRKGADYLLDVIGFDSILEGAALVVTGEGASDSQTLMGKIPYVIMKRAKARCIPVWLVAGKVSERESLLAAGFDKVVCINDPEIVGRSHTAGRDPMDPETARRRLHNLCIGKNFSLYIM